MRSESRIHSFAYSKAGTTGLIFAISAIPLLAIIGIGVDYSRTYSVQKILQASADAAVLAARGSGHNAEAEAKATAESIFQANSSNLPSGAVLDDVDVVVVSSGAEIEVTAKVPVTFSAILGFHEFTVKAIAKAAAANGDIELALVLDNTGSMRNDMSALKTAATALVNKIYDTAGNQSMVKIAVVPYVGAVNIGNSALQRSWMDTGVRSSLHGHEFAWQWFGYDPGCTHTSTGGGGSGPGTGLGGSDRQSLLDSPGSKYAFLGWMSMLLGITPAQATVPTPFLQDGCFIKNPGTVNLFDLFDKIPNASWKGCVEARQQPYDVDDTPPSIANGDTLFVPYFWPDEPDSSHSASIIYNNNYIDDAPGLLPLPYIFEWTDGANWDWARNVSIMKYNNANATIDESAPGTTGPNAACPDELLPLTNSKFDVLDKIDSLSHWNGSGTVSSEGLMWGWRVLSPTEPFTQGKPYGDAKKVIVLMTDGRNQVVEQEGYATYSDFTAYGNVARARTPDFATYAGYRDALDQRLLTACANAKAQGVEIYTVTFGTADPAIEAIYKQCATKPPMHYAATVADELVGAFQQIALGLSKLRLSE